MHRVLVIGPGGSGKSWLATRIAEVTGLPLIHLDAHYWRAGWRPTPAEEWREKVSALVARDRWVMGGNYGGTLDIRLAACDTVVFLDLPRRVTIPRVIRRWIHHRGETRPDMAPGCPDRLTWEFMAWLWSYPRRRRPQVLQKLGALSPDRSSHVLCSREAIAQFLATLKPTP